MQSLSEDRAVRRTRTRLRRSALPSLIVTTDYAIVPFQVRRNHGSRVRHVRGGST